MHTFQIFPQNIDIQQDDKRSQPFEKKNNVNPL